MQQHYGSRARRIIVVVGQHNDAKIKCDQLAFLNTAFYSYDKNVFCGNRCYLFCTSILHDIKMKRGQKNRILKKQALCVYFSETSLCMPMRSSISILFSRLQMFAVVPRRRVFKFRVRSTSTRDVKTQTLFFLHVEPARTNVFKKSGFDFISRRRLRMYSPLREVAYHSCDGGRAESFHVFLCTLTLLTRRCASLYRPLCSEQRLVTD